MTDQELERRVRAWFRAEIDDDRAPTELQFSVSTAVHASSVSASRRRDLLNFALAAAAVVAILAVASLTLNLFAPSFGVGPTPTSTATESPSHQSSSSPYGCGQGVGSCRGDLQPGTYPTRGFLPGFSYTVPSGWQNDLDVRSMLVLLNRAGGQYTYPDGTTFHDGIYVFRRPNAASATSPTVAEGVGTKARDLAVWLGGHVDLIASVAAPVTIGNASGFRLEIALPTTPRTSPDRCTTDHREPRCVSLFVSNVPAAKAGGPDWYSFGIVGPETAVIYLLDTPSGDTVMVVIDDVDGVDPNVLFAAATPIVRTIVFAP